VVTIQHIYGVNMNYEHEVGCYGNVWVRSNYLAKQGDSTEGHYHTFDHVSLLTTGKVKVEVEGTNRYNIFEAPTFIVIDKDLKHKFIALVDECVWYCVFALRDIDGNVWDRDKDSIYARHHSPLLLLNREEDRSKMRNIDTIINEQLNKSSTFDKDTKELENKTVIKD